MHMQRACVPTWITSIWRAIFPIFRSNNETSARWALSTFSWLLSSYIEEKDEDMNMLLPFLESSKSKALRNRSFSCCSRVDQNAGGSIHAFCPIKECTPQIAMSVQNITCQHVRVLAMKCGKLKSGKLNGKVLIIPTLVLVWQEKTAYTLQYRASTQQWVYRRVITRHGIRTLSFHCS